MRSHDGFTIIELLMVILLVSILAAVFLPQLINYGSDAKDAATKSALSTLRVAINNQYLNIATRCKAPGTYPTRAQLAANNIVNGGTPCTAAMIPNVVNRRFVAVAALPDNPWSGGARNAAKNIITQCVGATTGCNQSDATNCNGTAYNNNNRGWCYDPSNGKIWANSNRRSGGGGEYNF